MTNDTPDAALAEPEAEPAGGRLGVGPALAPHDALSPRGASSPVGRAPAWLMFLFPALGDLSVNPLYIRLSGQGYGRRGFGRWLNGPMEFRPGANSWLVLTRLGLWPFCVLFVPWIALGLLGGYFFHRAGGGFVVGRRIMESASAVLAACGLWAFLFVTTRMICGRPRHWAIHFFRRARLEGWGEDLLLSGLSEGDIKRAVFAAALPRLAVRILLWGGCWVALILYNTGAREGGINAMTLTYWAGTWIFFSGLEAVDVANELALASLGGSAAAAPRNAAADFIASGLAVFAMTLPALFVHWVFTSISGFNFTPDKVVVGVNFALGFLEILLTCFLFRIWINRRALGKL